MKISVGPGMHVATFRGKTLQAILILNQVYLHCVVPFWIMFAYMYVMHGPHAIAGKI